VTRTLSPSTPNQYWLAGLASGLSFGLSPLVWSQAVITEVYALHSLFVALLLYLLVIDSSSDFAHKRNDRILGLTFGLAMGNHLTTLLFLPVILLSTISRKPSAPHGIHWMGNWHLDSRSMVRRLAWLGVGLLVYLTLPLRALSKSPVNWGNPVSLQGFAWLVSGKLYQGQLFTLSLPSIMERARAVVALILQQFGIPGLTVGLIGLILFFKPVRLYFGTLWILVVSSVFAIGFASADAFMYMIPAFLCFAIWIGMGLAGIMDTTSRRMHIIGPLIGLVLILVLVLQTGKAWRQLDASQDQRAETFGKNVLSLAPDHAIVFAKGDRAVFALWYFQYALHNRTDLAVLATDLLQYDWYQLTLHSVYPALNVPGPYPFAETVVVANSERPVCYVQYIESAEISCFPARNPKSP